MAHRNQYTLTAIWLHWIIALLMVANTALAWSLDDWPDAWVRPAVDMHKSIGVTVLGLVAMRLLWRAAHAPPPLPAGYAPLERLGAHAGHFALYIVMIALPISGWLHDLAWKDWAAHPLRLFGLVPWPRIGFVATLAPDVKEHWHHVFGAAHRFISYAFFVLFAAHVLAALKHQFFDNERELQRMWPASGAEG